MTFLFNFYFISLFVFWFFLLFLKMFKIFFFSGKFLKMFKIKYSDFDFGQKKIFLIKQILLDRGKKMHYTNF